MQLSYILFYYYTYFVVSQGQQYEEEETQQLPSGVTGNVVMSMMAVYMGLGVLSFASSGEVLSEIRDALHLDNDEATDSAFSSIQDLFREAQRAGFLVSSCLFVHARFGPPRAELVMIARELFFSNIRRLDFDDEEKAVRRINKWAKKTSGGVITDLVYPDLLRPVPNVFLANVVYFKGKWKYGFEKTEPQFFSVTRNYVVTKDMMYIQQLFRYRDSPSLDAEVIQLPLYNTRTIVHVMLPRQTSELGNLEERVYDLSLDGKLVEELRLSVERPVRLWIPKFSFESRNDMKKLFRLIGVRKVFLGTSGGLERLVLQPADRAGPPLSAAVQSARIDISAYSNTIYKDLNLVINEDKSAMNFKANRPFFFVLTVDDSIVLLGKYTGIDELPLTPPTSPNPSPMKILRSRPNDRDEYENYFSNDKPAKNITYCVIPPSVSVMNMSTQAKETKPNPYEDGVEIANRSSEIEVGSI